MPADLRLVATFVEVARRLSFSGAARALGLTPGSVSQNIRHLEDQLGARLLTRTTRQVRLTAEGARYLARCAPALEALDAAQDALREERDAVAGRLRITSTTAFGRAALLPVVAAFMAAHPAVEIEIALSDRFVDMVADGFDLGFRAGILPVNEYVSRLVLPVTPLVCAAPDQPLPRAVAEIARHRVIGLRPDGAPAVLAWEFAAPGGGVLRHEIAPALVVNEPEALALACAEGAGLAQIGSNVAMPLVAAGRLRLALTAQAVRSRGIYAVHPSRRFLPRRVTLFIEAAAAAMAARTDLLPPAQAGGRTTTKRR